MAIEKLEIKIIEIEGARTFKDPYDRNLMIDFDYSDELEALHESNPDAILRVYVVVEAVSNGND